MARLPFTALACAIALQFSSVALAQPPAVRGGRLGGGISSAMLLQQEPVQKELGLSAEQIAKVNSELSSTGGDQRGFRDMSDEERQKAMDERAKLIAEQDRVIAAMLDAKQSERLKQIRIQAMGPLVFMVEPFAKELGISEEQSNKVREAMRSGRQGGGDMAEQREKMNATLMENLTADQKAKLKELQGPAFDVSQLQLRWGGGGRRGGE